MSFPSRRMAAVLFFAATVGCTAAPGALSENQALPSKSFPGIEIGKLPLAPEAPLVADPNGQPSQTAPSLEGERPWVAAFASSSPSSAPTARSSDRRDGDTCTRPLATPGMIKPVHTYSYMSALNRRAGVITLADSESVTTVRAQECVDESVQEQSTAFAKWKADMQASSLPLPAWAAAEESAAKDTRDR